MRSAPRQLSEGLAAALVAAHRAAALSRIELGTLSTDETREFPGEKIAAADASALYEQSGGNPFYLGRLLLEGAAVAGDPFEPELAAAAAATYEAAAIDVLDELLQLDLIRSTDVPRRFRFRHPLVRRAVYETTAARRPRALLGSACQPRGERDGARPPRGALGARRRPRRGRPPARGRRGRCTARAGKRAVVR